MKKLLIVCVLLITITDVYGQYRRRYKPGGRECIVCSVSVGVGYYIPSMAYLKEETPYVTSVGEGLSGDLTYNLSVEGRVVDNLFVGIGAGLWTNSDRFDTVGVGNVTVFEELKFRFIMLDAHVRYEFDLGNPFRGGGFLDIFHPYVGAGGSMFLMNQQFERQIGDLGNNIDINYNFLTFNAFAGANFDLINHLALGVEYRHIFGSFDQGFREGNVETVSVSGPMPMIKLTYQFFSRTARDLRHRRTRGSRFGRRR